MPCYKPLKAFWSPRNDGKKAIKFYRPDFYNFIPYEQLPDDFKIDIPCGQCVGCRLDYSKQWATRCVLESLQYEHNYFITLTYNNEFLPQKENYVIDYETGEAGEKFYSAPLVPEHLTKFMKDLREYFRSHYEHVGIRFFACGEYGESSMRPHFHILLFNCPIPDLEFLKSSFNGDTYWTSEILDKIWSENVGKDENGKTIYKPKGFVLVANLNYDTCAYVARYMLKKQKGFDDKLVQKGLTVSFYDKLGLIPPFTRSSRMPGIAKDYYDKERDKIYEYDEIIITNGKGIAKKVKPPKYYDRLYDVDNPEDLQRVKNNRSESAENSLKQKLAKTSKDKDTYLATQEDIRKDKMTRLLRPLF